ncbi:MAG: DHH family phosphoesterase [Kiritimatiellae bacterium]|nr:DHH family phosphoesterase [Kiritimatiellia bacterium]
MNEVYDINTKDLDTVADILALIADTHRVAISAHTYPDGDAVGSCIAMAGFLRAVRKDVTIVLPKEDVGPVRVLDGFEGIVDPDAFDFSVPPDLFVCLDCADPSRICDARIREWVGKIPTLNIDHHGRELFGTKNFVVKDASSTGELVYDIARAAGWTIDRPIAEALWCAILTDTCRFTTPSTRPSTLRTAAALAEKGVRIAWLAEQIYQRESFNAFDLRRRAINSLECWFDGRVVTIALSTGDFAETGCKKQDGETFPEIPNSLEGVQLAVFFYPFPISDSGHTRISARSHADSPITAKMLAAHFGGGGHEHSAAATPALSIAETKRAVQDWLATVFN